jgi:hypothetical protein
LTLILRLSNGVFAPFKRVRQDRAIIGYGTVVVCMWNHPRVTYQSRPLTDRRRVLVPLPYMYIGGVASFHFVEAGSVACSRCLVGTLLQERHYDVRWVV